MPERRPDSQVSVRDAAYAQAAAFELPDGWDARRAQVFPIAIDSSTTKDRDDAIAFDNLPDGGHRLRISIADVGSFLPRLPHVEAYARIRGETEYLRTSNVPMIPPAISEDKLSLHAFEPRPALGVSIELTPEGDIRNTQLGFEAVRAVNMTYEGVASYLKGHGNEGTVEKMHGFSAMANHLLELRREKGAAAFYLPEKGIMTDIDGNVVSITRGADHSARLVVQEFMIMANNAVAEYASYNGIPFLYRNHKFRDNASVKDITAILDQEQPNRQELGRIYERARYSPERIGHAALNLDAYAHFTSPLRRGADAFNHANIAAFMRGESPPYSSNILAELAERFNKIQDERRASFRARQLAHPSRVEAASVARRARGTRSETERTYTPPPLPGLANRLTAAIELQQVSSALQAEITNRIDAGALTAADAGRLFGINPGELLPEVEQELVRWCAKHPAETFSALSTAFTSLGTIRGLSQEVSDVPVDLISHYKVDLRFTTLEGIVVSASAIRPSKKQALQRASVKAVHEMYGIEELPDNTESTAKNTEGALGTAQPEATANGGHINPKSRLQEFTQARRCALPKYRDERTEDGFTSIATVTVKDQSYTAAGKGGTVKEAQKDAAQKICEELGITIDVAENPVAQKKIMRPEVSKPENNPIGHLGEYCAKRHLPMPEYAASKIDGVHSCTVTLGKGENVRHITATGTNSASAKRKAARRAIEQGLDFLTEPDNQS